MAGQPNTAEFVTRLWQAIPEAEREQHRSAFSALNDRIRAVDETHQRQVSWWETNKNAVAERDQLKEQLAAAGRATSNSTPEAVGMDQNQIAQAIQAAQASTLETGLGLVTTITQIGMNHFKEFGEVINAQKLAEDAIAARLPIDQFYNQSVAQRRTERQNAEIEAKIAAARNEGMESGRKEIVDRLGGSLPFPSVSGQVAAPRTLDGLRKPADAAAANPFSLEAAVATANAVMAGQNK